MTMPAAETAFERIGGATAVRRVVDRLYACIVRDDQLFLTYFEPIDLPRLKAHMVKLLSQVLGGPAGYSGRDLREAHAHLRDANGSPVRVTAAHYHRVCDYVIAALLIEHAPPDVVDAVKGVLAQVQGDIVGAGAAA